MFKGRFHLNYLQRTIRSPVKSDLKVETVTNIVAEGY